MPLLWLALAFLCGIVLGAQLPQPWPVWAGLAVGIALLVFAAGRLKLRGKFAATVNWLARRPQPLSFAPVVLLCAGLCGALRYQLAEPVFTPDSLKSYNNRARVTLSGVIVSPPEAGERSVRLVVDSSTLALDGSPSTPVTVHGRALVQAPTGVDWRYGDQVSITGLMQDPPDEEDFSYRDYLAHQRIYSYIPYAGGWITARDKGSPVLAAIYSLRSRAIDTVMQLFPPPESALLAGILLGDDSRMPPELTQAFQDTGTAHIIAISGFKNPLTHTLMLQSHLPRSITLYSYLDLSHPD